MDCFLREEDTRRVGDFVTVEIPNDHALHDFLLLSQLWVFGVHEMLRTLDQQLRDSPAHFSVADCASVKAMKRTYERIRVPLAKQEPAYRFKDNDEVPIGARVLRKHLSKGWCWRIGEDRCIWRVDLTDEFLKMLEHLPQPPEFGAKR